MKKIFLIAISVVFLLIVIIGVIGLGSKKADCSGIEDQKQKNRCHLYNLLNSYGFVNDYEQFMKTKPYEKPAPKYFTMNFRDDVIDDDGDGKFDALRIYVQVNLQEEGDYAIDSWAYIEDNPFFKFEKIEALPAGISEITLEIPSQKIREKRLVGSLNIPFVNLLRNGKQVDSITDGYLTKEYHFDDFSAILPDLVVKSAVKTGDTLQVIIANVGNKHAFAVFIDLISDGQEIIGKANPYQANLMKIGDEKTFNIDLKGKKIDAVIVDPWNKVDESDEENNIFPIP